MDKVHDGKAAFWGVRPEHLILGKGGMAVEVSVIEPMGSETQLFAKVGGQRIVALVRQRLAAKPGDKLSLVADTSAIHLFDAETRQRF